MTSLLTLVLAALLAALGSTDRARTFTARSASMAPTIGIDDRVTTVPIEQAQVRRCDVVLFHPPAGVDGEVANRGDSGSVTVTAADELYVHRVLGLPGERIEVRADGRVLIDGELRPPPPAPVAATAAGRVAHGPLIVPDTTIYVLGDDRDNSADSRVFGFVPLAFVQGRATEVAPADGSARRVLRRSGSCG